MITEDCIGWDIIEADKALRSATFINEQENICQWLGELSPQVGEYDHLMDEFNVIMRDEMFFDNKEIPGVAERGYRDATVDDHQLTNDSTNLARPNCDDDAGQGGCSDKEGNISISSWEEVDNDPDDDIADHNERQVDTELAGTQEFQELVDQQPGPSNASTANDQTRNRIPEQMGRGLPDDKETNVKIRDLYTFKVRGTDNWADDDTVQQVKVDMRIKPGFLTTVPDNHLMYGMAIVDLATRVVPRDCPEIRMGVTLNADNWSAPLYAHLRKLTDYTANFLEREIEYAKQSAKDLGIAPKNLQVTLTLVRDVCGSGRMKMPEILNKLSEQKNMFRGGPDDPISSSESEDEEQDDPTVPGPSAPRRDKKTFRRVAKTNVTRMCLPIAIAHGVDRIGATTPAEKARVDKAWRRLDETKPNVSPECWQKAREVLRKAGITKDRHFTMEDIRKIQATMAGLFQIIVFSDSHEADPIYRGKYAGRHYMIGILYSKGHYEYIYNVPAFMGTKFYCALCNVRGSNEKLHYKCPLRCRKCLSYRCRGQGTGSYPCGECGVEFESQSCYDFHKQRGIRGGKSRCERTKTCTMCNGVIYLDKGYTHFCGMRYCRACRKEREPGHVHFLPPRPVTKDPSFKRIFFDTETMPIRVDGDSKKHQMVLASALRCCRQCRDVIPKTREEARELKCENCSPDGQRFWEFGIGQPDTLQRFGEWLFHDQHKDFSIIAHNMKGFDGQLLLQHLLQPHIPKPKMMIMNGKKVNFLSVAGTKTLDSFNYVPFGLKKFTKAFEIEELKKGDFPFHFIRPRNFDYVGPMPDRRYYGYDQKSLDEKEKFDQFYDPLVAAGYQFEFDKELRDYCYSDVALLAKGMTKFERYFYDKTSVALFEETVTAAGAAMLVFQRNFVQPDTIALDTEPSSPRINQSAFARRYLAWRQSKIPHHQIQSYDTLGEYKIPGTNYHVDGFIHPCQEYPRGKVIEVHGCFWHACGCSYAENTVVRDNKKAITIRNDDEKRRRVIRRHYDLEVVWECQIRQQALQDKELANWLARNMGPGPVVCREALYGGRTEPIRLWLDTQNGTKKLYYLDFTSLYPYVMKNCLYPKGLPRRLISSDFTGPFDTAEQLESQCRGYVSCKIAPPDRLFLPVLPYRAEKLLFSLCRTCGEQLCEGPCRHNDDERALYGTWTSVELSVAIRLGYRVLEVYGGMHWDNWCGDLFSGYINEFLKEKQQASGIPKHCKSEAEIQDYIEKYYQKEGIRLERGKLHDHQDEVSRNVAKLLLNSLWGKFGQRVDVTSTQMVSTTAQLFRVINDPTVEIIRLDIINRYALLVHTRSMSGALQPLPTSAMPYAVFTTSHARAKLYEAISRVPDPEQNLLYMDTDSLIYAAPADEPNPLEAMCGDYLGDLTNELKGEMLAFVTIGAKSYSYLEKDESGRVTTKVKSKGFPLNCDAERKINFQLMKDMVDARLRGDPNPPQASIDYDVIKRTAHHDLIPGTLVKKLAFTFDKRIIRPDGGTVPYGYR